MRVNLVRWACGRKKMQGEHSSADDKLENYPRGIIDNLAPMDELFFKEKDGRMKQAHF